MLAHSASVYVNMISPTIYLGNTMSAWWPISTGLIVEYIFLRHFFKFTIKKALTADFVMNLASALMKIVLIPLSGIIWEEFLGPVLYHFLEVGPLDLMAWVATFFFAAFINTVTESLTLNLIFKIKLRANVFLVLALTNAISVGVEFVRVLLSSHL